jgi:hypothetical protein
MSTVSPDNTDSDRRSATVCVMTSNYCLQRWMTDGPITAAFYVGTGKLGATESVRIAVTV